jgi:hypothetical protein
MYPKVYIYPLLKAKAANFSVNFCNKGLPEFSERRHTALHLPFDTEGWQQKENIESLGDSVCP